MQSKHENKEWTKERQKYEKKNLRIMKTNGWRKKRQKMGEENSTEKEKSFMEFSFEKNLLLRACLMRKFIAFKIIWVKT